MAAQGGSEEGAELVDDITPQSGLICKVSCIIKTLELNVGLQSSGLLMSDYERTSTPVVTQRSYAYGYDACELEPRLALAPG